MRRLEEIYLIKKTELKSKLNSFKSKFSITCDIWTSKNQLSFFGFTIHYIDNDWKLQESLLAFKFLEGEHDGFNLAEYLVEVLEEFGITDRLLGITADNASNNSTMISHLDEYFKKSYPDAGFNGIWNQVECMAHVLNLGAQEILKGFKNPIDVDTYEADSDSNDDMVSAVSRLSFLVRKIRKSPKMRRLMQQICLEKGEIFLVPIIDVSTRWNSTHDMLVRALKLKDVICDTIYRYKDKTLINILLSESDWQCVEKLVDVLAPLKEATLLASKNAESLMVTNIIPIFQFCTDSLEESLKSFEASDDIYMGIQAGLEKLIHYYDNISPIVGVTLFLDPSKKRKYLIDALDWKTGWVDSVMDNFMSSFDFYKSKLSECPAAVEPSANESGSQESLFQQYKRRKLAPQSGKSNNEEEFRRYFNSPLAKEDTNVLDFWKAHSVDYPILSAMAKDYLTVQASSVPAERAFASGTDLVTPDRCSLGGKTIEMTQFLKFHL
jgi:hypothetical protein